MRQLFTTLVVMVAVLALTGIANPGNNDALRTRLAGDEAAPLVDTDLIGRLRQKQIPFPNDHVGYISTQANGIYDPLDPDFVPPTGDDFDTLIMGRTAEEAAAFKEQARAFLAERFGLDFAQDDITPDFAVVLQHIFTDPRQDYSATYIAGREFHPEQWVLYDGLWAAIVIDPTGATVHGTYGGAAGRVIPFGGAMVFGEYVIVHPHHPLAGLFGMRTGGGHPATFRGRRAPVHIQYQSEKPVIPPLDPTAAATFDCRALSAEFGQGIILGRGSFPLPLADGNVQTNIRSVMTFPAPQWALELWGSE